MKKPLLPAPAKGTAVKVPSRINRHHTLIQLSPLALQLLIYMIGAWEKRKNEIRHIPPSQRGPEATTFRIPWRSLQMHLRPDATGTLDVQVYAHLKAAGKELIDFYASSESRFHFHHLIEFVVEDTNHSTFIYKLVETFDVGWSLLLQQGYALVPLHDALALHSSRQIRMLMLLCGVKGLNSVSLKTFTLKQLRAYFALEGEYYDSPAAVLKEMDDVLKSVLTALPHYKATMLKEKDTHDRRRVVGVKFELLSNQPRKEN